MKKYGKSILSVAAAVAISSSMLCAEYMPLTTNADDNRWILFGVNGFHGSSGASGTLGEFTIPENDSYTWIDNDNDAQTTEPSVDDPTNGFGWIDAIDGVAYVQARVNVSGFTSVETDPVRTMYFTDTNGVVKFGFTYKAVLEGETIEFQTSNGGDVFATTLNSDATYDNPVVAGSADAPKAGAAGSSGDTLSSLDPSNVDTYMVDYNLSNNPADVNEYASSYNDGVDDEILSMYAYDSSNGTWLYHDSRNDVAYNDFNALEIGRGYWGKLITDNTVLDASNGDNQLSGLIMGSGYPVGATAYSGMLNDGWNLISFGAGNTEIRRSTTGMLVDINATNTVAASRTIELFDSALNQTVSVSLDVNGTDSDIAQNINYAIARGKVDGSIQNVFDLKAFPTATAGRFALMSNKKFGIRDNNASINTITAMAGSNLWVDTNNTSAGTSVDPVASSIYTSTYGEYFLIVEPLTGANSAENLGSASKVNVVASDGTSEAADITTDLTTSTGNLDGITFVNAIEIDVDADGTNDYTLMSSAEPFYLRDMTIARTYKYVSDGASGEIEVTNLPSYSNSTLDANITIADTNATDIADDINGTYGLLAYGENTNDKIVVISSDGNITATDTAKQSSVNFGLSFVSGGDNLVIWDSGSVVSAPAGNIGKGAIGSVYAPNDFIKETIENTLTLDLNGTSTPNGVDNNYTITVQNMFDVNVSETNISVPADLDGLATAINSFFADKNISSTATADTANVDIVITGYDLIAATLGYDDTNNSLDINISSTNGLGKLDKTGVATLTTDLKYNSEFTPNYVMDGPLYTINDAGFKLEALVSGSTLMTDGNVNWESIDLTRDTADWLLTQDYNLFEIDERAGYWAYLTSQAEATLGYVSSSAVLGGELYKTFYDNGVATNFYSSNINIELTGISATALTDDSARVLATVAAEDVELTQDTAGSTTYTGKVSLVDNVAGAATGNLEDVVIKVADGLGNYEELTVPELAIDNEKPNAPSVVYSSGTLTITESNSSDVAKYYVFQNNVTETGTGALDTYVPADFSAGTIVVTDICANANPVTIASAAGTLNVVAIDNANGSGDGTFGTGNSSDIASDAFMPISKSRIVLTDTQTAGDIDASTGGVDYNSSCASVSTTTQNLYGVQVTAYTNEVKIAFPKVVEGGPYTEAQLVNVIYISDGTDIIAQIKFRDDYDTQEFFIQANGVTYGGTLDKTHNTSGTALDVSGNVKTGVTF